MTCAGIEKDTRGVVTAAICMLDVAGFLIGWHVLGFLLAAGITLAVPPEIEKYLYRLQGYQHQYDNLKRAITQERDAAVEVAVRETVTACMASVRAAMDHGQPVLPALRALLPAPPQGKEPR